ncbi:hypothetical protein C3L33_01206, partial [Rhododendron williamsianum]
MLIDEFDFREPPDLSGLEISEQRAVEMARKFKSGMEEGIRWMLRVAVEGDCFTFAGTIAALWVFPNWEVTLIYSHFSTQVNACLSPFL